MDDFTTKTHTIHGVRADPVIQVIWKQRFENGIEYSKFSNDFFDAGQQRLRDNEVKQVTYGENRPLFCDGGCSSHILSFHQFNGAPSYAKPLGYVLNCMRRCEFSIHY